MANTNSEQMKKELWYSFFTEYLYKNQTISEEQKILMEKLISK